MVPEEIVFLVLGIAIGQRPSGSAPVRIASGVDDPFHPGVVALSKALPGSGHVEFAAGCHDSAFFASQQLAFLAGHARSA
jgi:hypothetical protein